MDKTLDVLAEIEAKLTTETAAGGTLQDVGSFFVMRTSADEPPEYGAANPMLMVMALDQSGEEIFIPPIGTEKRLPVQFALFTENGGDTTNATPVEIINIVEQTFRQEVFGFQGFSFDFVSRSNTRTSFPPFSGDWNGVAEYVCQYTYTDMIGECDMSTNILRYSVSPDTEVFADSTLSVGYDELRIYGDATLTNTPTIHAGVDGQRLTIVGLNDLAMPKIQDESALPGSGIRLQQKLDFTFGKNDSMLLTYSSAQKAWVERGRADVY